MEQICIIPLNISDEELIAIKELAKLALPLIISDKQSCMDIKVLNIGNPYYCHDNTIPWDDSTNFLKDIIPIDHEFNQCLINVYDNPKANIKWHCERITNLTCATVLSMSFAMHQEDNAKTLAFMEFKQGKNGNIQKQIPLEHSTCILFNAAQHANDNIYHRVAKTECSRVNLTFQKTKT